MLLQVRTGDAITFWDRTIIVTSVWVSPENELLGIVGQCIDPKPEDGVQTWWNIGPGCLEEVSKNTFH